MVVVPLIATVIGLFFFAQVCLQSPQIFQSVSVRLVLWTQLVYHWLWVPLVPVIAWLARRWKLTGPTWKRSLLLHASAAGVMALTEIVVGVTILWALGQTRHTVWVLAVRRALINVPVAYPVYWVVLVVLSVMTSRRECEERDLAAAELSSKLSEARLAALKAQLDPHFLFNTLHSLSGVMRRNPAVAARALRELGDLVMATSESSRKSEVRLGEELELLERYLRIERLRFGDRLRFQLDVPPETLDVPVPPFILQPLVENAVTHGVGHRVSGGTVVVRAYQRERSLLLEVKDDGVGIARGELVEGIGLRNTRERIHQLYGDEGRFELDASPGEGFGVSIGIPFRSWRANVFAP